MTLKTISITVITVVIYSSDYMAKKCPMCKSSQRTYKMDDVNIMVGSGELRGKGWACSNCGNVFK